MFAILIFRIYKSIMLWMKQYPKAIVTNCPGVYLTEQSESLRLSVATLAIMNRPRLGSPPIYRSSIFFFFAKAPEVPICPRYSLGTTLM